MSSIGDLSAQSRLASVEDATRFALQAPASAQAFAAQIGRSTKGRASGRLSMEVEA
jgi:hypothetical protein